MLTSLTIISLLVISLFFIIAILPRTIEPTDNIRWKLVNHKYLTIYKIQKQFWFIWINAKINNNGQLEDLYFDNRSDIKAYVSKHMIKKCSLKIKGKNIKTKSWK